MWTLNGGLPQEKDCGCMRIQDPRSNYCWINLYMRTLFYFFYSNGATVCSGVVSRPGTLRMSKIEHGHFRRSPRWFFSPRREANRIKYSQSAEDNWKCWWLTQTFCRLGMLEFCTCFVGWQKHRMNETPRRVDKIFLMGTCGVLCFLSKPTWAMLCSKVVYLMYCTRAVTGVSSAARNRGSSLQPAILRASASTKSTKSDGVTEACIAVSVKLAYKYSLFGALHSMHFDSSSFWCQRCNSHIVLHVYVLFRISVSFPKNLCSSSVFLAHPFSSSNFLLLKLALQRTSICNLFTRFA